MDPWEAYDMMQSQIAQNNSWNAEQAQKQMDFQERMSSTAHAREVADLKASGLNPVLSAKLGGASTPSGAMAQSDPSATSALMNIIDRMLDISQAQAYGNAYSAKGAADAEEKDGEDKKLFGLISYDDLGALGKWLFTGKSDGKTGSALGHYFKTAVNDFIGYFTKPYEYVKSDQFIQDLNNAWNGVKKVGAWIGDAGNSALGALNGLFNNNKTNANVITPQHGYLHDYYQDIKPFAEKSNPKYELQSKRIRDMAPYKPQWSKAGIAYNPKNGRTYTGRSKKSSGH